MKNIFKDATGRRSVSMEENMEEDDVELEDGEEEDDDELNRVLRELTLCK